MFTVKKQILNLEQNDNELVKALLPKDLYEVIEIKDLESKNKNIFVKEVIYKTYSNISYEKLVNRLVKERYSDSEEFAILRKSLNGKTAEFNEYNIYVEECKKQAKAFIEERAKVLGE